MIVSILICIPFIPTCGAYLIHPPVENRRKNHHRRPLMFDRPSMSILLRAASGGSSDDELLINNNDDDIDESGVDVENWESLSAELLLEDEDDGFNDGEWLTDRVKARLKLERQQEQQQNFMKEEDLRSSTTRIVSENDDATIGASSTTTASAETARTFIPNRPSPYTDEEEEIIAAMGGKSKQRRREPGFLGDSTLVEICTDYSVPISYLADVLCMWDVPVPININDRLGDLVTGEQAFAIVEAVNTLDVAALHDRYSNTNLLQLCYEWDIDIQPAFEMAMKEGWSLPFGVQTCLRVEQERELLRVLGSQAGLVDRADDDEYDDDYV